MIKSIKLQNFKSIVDINLELKQLNVLIGPNASGKSNFLSFFQLLQEGAQERLNLAINAMGGISNVIHYNKTSGVGDVWMWQLVFSKNSSHRFPMYMGQLYRSNSGYLITEEIRAHQDITEGDAGDVFLSIITGKLDTLVSTEGKIEKSDENLNSHELAIAQIRDRFRYPYLAEMRTTLADWQIYHGFGEEALRNMRNPQLFNVIDPLRLDPSGKNLLSVIQELANVRRYEAIYGRLLDAMRAVFPDFIKLYTPTSAGGMGSLFYGSKNFPESIPALNMSDGQLRFLGLVIILLLADLPNPPSLIVIDEPEIGMHPDMIAVFADLLKIASEKTQIIITTHSPQLIDAMSPEDIIVTERDEGQTTLRRLDSESLNRWLERYTLGKLWTMGKLGA